MTKEEFIKQRCEIDDITEEEFKNTYRVIECVCGEPYCNGYKCLDLDDLVKENQQLKEDIKDVDIWNKLYNEQFDRNRKLEENWNKLKEYIKQEPTLYFYNDKLPFEVIMVKIITKMQELEQESDNNDSN